MADPDQAEVIEGNYIGPIIRNLERASQQGQLYRIDVQCGVCLRDLDMSTKVGGLIQAECLLPPGQAAETKEKFYEKHNLERTVILPCGHMTGVECRIEQAAHPDMSARMCNYCKKDTKCAGCPMLIADGAFDPVQWPLDPAKYQPYQQFMAKVGLTPNEKDSLIPRFCQRCAEWQLRRKVAEIFLTFPRCTAGNCFPPAPGGQDPPPVPMQTANHEMWRERNVQRWLGQKVAEIAQLVYPHTGDIRDPQLRAQLEAEFSRERHNLVAYILDQEHVQAAARAAFRPCRQAGVPDPQGFVLTAGTIKLGFAMSETCAETFGKGASLRMPVAWFRGLEVPYQRHLPKYQVQNVNLDDPTQRAVQLFLMMVGEDSVDAANRRINNTMVKASVAKLIAWVKEMVQAGRFASQTSTQGDILL
ncbi:hypothetical protein PG996_007981 [Apiospora saccharicola]|uniref:RING-type domain-containing protein n=1 Tax=Apiospora saccharicola TaxID=335842 RepID=A0ABR1UWL7_9PEZI